MNENVQVRKIEEGDFHSLVDDLNPWGFKTKGPAYPQWLHESRPFHRVSWIATFENTIIGYYGTLTVPLKVENQIIYAYRGGPFVHPDHRKKRYNVLNLLTRAVFNEIKVRGGAAYIFPKPELIKYFARRMKCVRLKPIPRYICVLRLAPIFERFLKNKRVAQALGFLCQGFWRMWLHKFKRLPKGLTIKELHSFDERFDVLWEKASKAHKIISMRNAEYLNWRYTQEPGQPYVIFAAERSGEILGYVILRPADPKRGRSAWIADLLDVQEPDVTKALLGQAIEYFGAQGADKIEFYVSDDYYEKRLRSIGFMKRPTRPRTSEVLVGKCESSKIKKEIFEDPLNWFVTTADLLFA